MQFATVYSCSQDNTMTRAMKQIDKSNLLKRSDIRR